MKSPIIAPRCLVGLLLLALVLGVLSPAGIARAQCAGTVTAVECTGVDPDGWAAGDAAPGAATAITVRASAQVNGSIDLDGNDTLIIEAGSQISMPENRGVIGSHGPNIIRNAGTLTFVNGAGMFVTGDDAGGIEVYNTGRLNGMRRSPGGIGLSDIGQPSRVINSGWISAHTGLFLLSNTAPILIINTGTIDGSERGIYSQSTPDILVNSGLIRESASLMEENDTFIAAGGTLGGGLSLSAGDDTFMTLGGTVAGRIDGGPGFDTLVFAFDVRDVDYAILAQKLANAAPDGDTLTYILNRYTWEGFERIVDRLNIIPTAGGPAITPPAIGGDGRLNDLDAAASAIVYPLGGGGVALRTGQGELAFEVDAVGVLAGLEAAEDGEVVSISARVGVTLYALPNANLLATGPDGYAFAFQASRCGVDG